MLRKYLILILLTTATLSANLQNVQKLFNQKKYQEALKAARSATDSYANVALHLLWARAAQKLGRTEEAMSAYERVLILDPENKEAKNALMAIYEQTNRTVLAQNLENNEDEQSADKLSTLTLSASLMGGYDSNVNYSTSADILDGYYGPNIGLAEVSSLFTNADATLSYFDDFTQKGGWFMQSDFNGYMQNNFSAHQYDLLMGGASVGIGYYTNKYSFLLPLKYNNLYYLQGHMFEEMLVHPHFLYSLHDNLLVEAKVKYSQRRYAQRFEGMDSNINGGALAFYYTGQKHFFNFGLQYDDFTSARTVHYYYVDKRFTTLNFNYSYLWNKKIKVEANYRYRYGVYDDLSDIRPTVNSHEKRCDHYNHAEVKFSYTLNKNFDLLIAQRFVKNLSNTVPARYKKSVSSVGINFKY